ncbi:hypothetical protein ACQJBY_037910 [Aegilops geniculata]
MRPQLQSSPRVVHGAITVVLSRRSAGRRGGRLRPALVPPYLCLSCPQRPRLAGGRRGEFSSQDAGGWFSPTPHYAPLASAALCSGSSPPRSAPACRHHALLRLATEKVVLSVQGADGSPDPSATPWTSPGTRAGMQRRQPATPTPTSTNPPPQEVEAESMMLVSGPRVAVSWPRRADCHTVPALMKMNMSFSSMPVGISEKTAKEAEDNVLPREMHNIQYSYVLHNAPHKVPAPFPAAVRRRERR